MEQINVVEEERKIDLKNIIKLEIEKQIMEAGAADIIKIIKIRTAELTIALQEFENLRKLGDEDREKIVQEFNNLRKLGDEDREKIVQEFNDLRKLGDEDRGKIVREFNNLRKLGDEDREKIVQEFNDLRKLGDEDRKKIVQEFNDLRKLGDEDRGKIVQEFNDLRKLGDEDRKNAMQLLQVIAENLNIFTNKFTENTNIFREELRTQNSDFMRLLDEGKPFEKLISNIEKQDRRLNEKIEKLEKKLEKSGLKTYLFLILLIVIGFVGTFYLQKEAIISLIS